eukprot:COSAG05_NODE_1513_length_4667_cov_51.337785_3_plen_82_part_00
MRRGRRGLACMVVLGVQMPLVHRPVKQLDIPPLRVDLGPGGHAAPLLPLQLWANIDIVDGVRYHQQHQDDLIQVGRDVLAG